jgi:hypothetical protein
MSGLASRLAGRVKGLDRELFVQVGRDPARAAIVLGSGRGGTTWIAEGLARHAGSRLIFEPFHPSWSPYAERLPLFIDPEAGDAAARAAATRVLEGRVRRRELDQVRTARLPRARVVKDIHTTNCLPWYRREFPAVPIVYVVRHPIATALSRLRWTGSFYGISRYLASAEGRRQAEQSPAARWLATYDECVGLGDPLLSVVAEWCLENAYPLTWAKQDQGVALVYYETAVTEGAGELGRLSAFCAEALGGGSGRAHSASALRRPSAMDWYGTAASATSAADWQRRLVRWTEEVDSGLAGECMSVVDEFGIELAYDAGPLPAVTAGSAGKR